MSEQTRTSPMVWIGCGCLLSIGLVLVVLGGLVYFGKRFAEEIHTEMKDPESRAAKAREILGCEVFPEGYYPVAGFSIPLIAEIAILSDHPPTSPEDLHDPLGERGFVYVNSRSFQPQRRQVDDFFAGKSDRLEGVKIGNIDIQEGQTIHRGAMQLEAMEIRYVVQRSGLWTEGRHVQGITNFIDFQCPGEQRLRLGIWFGPDPSPDRPVTEIDLADTPADEAALRQFLGYFEPCST